jgi:NADPH:quinone reductase-like Zn-dependent oxidoreductase
LPASGSSLAATILREMPSATPTMPLGLAIAGAGADVRAHDGADFETIEIEGYEVRCGFATVDPRPFEPDGANKADALIEVTAFSCNYRDKALILRMTVIPSERGCYVIGSELAGRVVAVGSEVGTLEPGDRVMVDGFFGTESRPWGLPTNHASRSLQILPAVKLMRVPDAMSDEVAAAFTIGAQTSFSMVRRAGVGPGSEVLVTAGTSNTSLFLLQAARREGATVSVTTTSEAAVDRLRALGAAQVFVLEPDGPRFDAAAIGEYAKSVGGFAAVLDPYFDLYLERAVPALASFGVYVTCGLERQFPSREALRAGVARKPVLHDDVLAAALTRNISVVGNCLGSTTDLERGRDAFVAGELQVELDRVMEAEGAAAFLSRTYCERGRFGKVVYRYAEEVSAGGEGSVASQAAGGR